MGRTIRFLKVSFERQVLRNLRYDFPASIVVFLVALPLCLGIALASDAPLFSGVITGVIAGMIVAPLSGSSLSISGPAAGLTVIVAGGIHTAGAFEAFLVAVVLSGIFQIILGLVRAGAIASLFPHCVIKGMLTAIGVTIILKQIPHAFGGAGGFESDMLFMKWIDNDSAIAQIVGAVVNLKPAALFISAGSIALLIFWETKTIKNQAILSKVPGPLLAVLLGAVINQLFHFSFPENALHAADGHLVSLPKLASVSDLMGELRFPDWSALSNQGIWILAATIAAVGSIETLLCLESTDKLDPLRRVSLPNRELLAQGIGNILSGLVGGIPMTSVIVRSSANIYAGARTRTSGFLHGLTLLISALALAPALNLIPLASLAAVLIVVGFKLAHPTLIKKSYQQGADQFVPFVITVAAILSTDLLKGVMIGFVVGLAFVIKTSYYSAITVIRDGNDVLLRFNKDVTFIHKIKLRNELSAMEPGSRVLIDGARAGFIDHDIAEMLREFCETATSRGIDVEVHEIKREHKKVKKNEIVQKAFAG